MKITLRMKKLLELLKQLEADAVVLTDEAFESLVKEKANYQGIATYRSKYLDGKVIHPQANGRMAVSGALVMSESDFAYLLSQKKTDLPHMLKYDTQDEWADAMRTLAEIGLGKGFILSSEDRDLFLDLLES